MKYLIGIVVTIIILSLGLYFTLDLWNIELPITEEELRKGLITTGIVNFVFLILLIIIPFLTKIIVKAMIPRKETLLTLKSKP